MRAIGRTRTRTDNDSRLSGGSRRSATAPAVFGAAVGALGGVALGFIAGPVGMLVGGIVGAVGGAGMGDAVRTIEEQHWLHAERVYEDVDLTGADERQISKSN